MKIIGDGGHAVVVRDIVRFLANEFVHVERGDTFIAIGENRARRREALARPRAKFATLIHPRAYVAPGVEIWAGTVIMAGAIVQPGARIGRHVILNTGCSVDHGCVIGDFAHIAPGAHLCGGVEVGEGALVGVGVGLEPGSKVPAWHIVKRVEYTVCPMK